MTASQQIGEFWMSRLHTRKRDAERDASMMRAEGAKYVRITGKRGQWKVRGKIKPLGMARFASVEAKREQGK